MVKRLLPVLLSAGILIYVALNIEPPVSFTQATPLQLAYFLIPVLLFFTSFTNVYFDFWPKSIAAGVGATLLLTFRALDMFNIASITITILATVLLIHSFKKPKSILHKQNQIQPLSRLKKQ